MHCNLRPPDVAPVNDGEADMRLIHSALPTSYNNSTTSADQQRTIYQISAQSSNARLSYVRRPQWAFSYQSRMERTVRYRLWKLADDVLVGSLCALSSPNVTASFRFQTRRYYSLRFDTRAPQRRRRLKIEKLRPNFALFSPRVKFKKGRGRWNVGLWVNFLCHT